MSVSVIMMHTMHTHLEVRKIITFSRILGDKDDSRVNPVEVGLERRSDTGTKRPHECSGKRSRVPE
jgi:hypothetical protein